MIEPICEVSMNDATFTVSRMRGGTYDVSVEHQSTEIPDTRIWLTDFTTLEEFAAQVEVLQSKLDQLVTDFKAVQSQ